MVLLMQLASVESLFCQWFCMVLGIPVTSRGLAQGNTMVWVIYHTVLLCWLLKFEVVLESELEVSADSEAGFEFEFAFEHDFAGGLEKPGSDDGVDKKKSEPK